MRRLLSVVVPLAMIGLMALTVLSAPAASAGPYTSRAEYQVGLSMNCNTPSFCGSDLGGFWGWAQFNFDGTADAQLVGCGHLRGGRQLAGASHFSVDTETVDGAAGWYVGSNGDFFITNETDTITGHTGGPPVTITVASEDFDTGIPAAPGHYSTSMLLGFTPPPGVSFQIQVVKLG